MQHKSPVVQSEDAKSRRDLDGEVEALMGGERALHSAPWYPAVVGDHLHIRYQGGGEVPAWEETYVVVEDFGLALRLETHTMPEKWAASAGAFARGGVPDDPFWGAWMEAGPHTMTIVRDGSVVHDGPGQ